MHAVIWDGRKDGPGGALLFADEHQRIQLVEPQKQSEHHGQFVDLVRSTRTLPEWFTALDVAERCGLSRQQAASVINGLVKRGEMEREQMGRCFRGCRTRPQRYRWVTR